MTVKNTSNLAASVQARLQNHARASKRPFQELLQYYAMERFLYRLSKVDPTRGHTPPRHSRPNTLRRNFVAQPPVDSGGSVVHHAVRTEEHNECDAVSAEDERRIVRLGKRLGVRSKAGVVRLAVDELERRVERSQLGEAIQAYVDKYGQLDRAENLQLSTGGDGGVDLGAEHTLTRRIAE